MTPPSRSETPPRYQFALSVHVIILSSGKSLLCAAVVIYVDKKNKTQVIFLPTTSRLCV